jgi:hypothetical protein
MTTGKTLDPCFTIMEAILAIIHDLSHERDDITVGDILNALSMTNATMLAKIHKDTGRDLEEIMEDNDKSLRLNIKWALKALFKE